MRIRVASAVSAAASMKSNIGEVSGQLFRPRRLAPVMDTERDIMAAQQFVNLACVPALVAEFDHKSVSPGKHAEKLSEPLHIHLPSWRQLEQDRAEGRAQGPGTRHKQIYRIPGIFEPLDVRNEAARLDSKNETTRSVLLPVLERLLLRQAVEAVRS